MSDIPLPSLCLVTDRSQCQSRPLDSVVAQAVRGGVNLVQLREKDLPAGRLLELAQRLQCVTSGRALLFINDRVDVALACGADGVQLGEEGLPMEAAREACGDRLLLGRSVHSVEGAVVAEVGGADFLVVGTIFPTRSHPGAEAAGVSLLERIGSRVRIPYLAIGGVSAENVGSVMVAGASGAAVITAITHSQDPERASSHLMKRMETAWNAVPIGTRPPMIVVTINGKERQMEGTISLLSYLESLGVHNRNIAVAYNGTVLRREEFPDVTLLDGDRVEIVRAIGGG